VTYLEGGGSSELEQELEDLKMRIVFWGNAGRSSRASLEGSMSPQENLMQSGVTSSVPSSPAQKPPQASFVLTLLISASMSPILLLPRLQSPQGLLDQGHIPLERRSIQPLQQLDYLLIFHHLIVMSSFDSTSRGTKTTPKKKSHKNPDNDYHQPDAHRRDGEMKWMTKMRLMN
jgi:hypothetical protein